MFDVFFKKNDKANVLRPNASRCVGALEQYRKLFKTKRHIPENIGRILENCIMQSSANSYTLCKTDPAYPYIEALLSINKCIISVLRADGEACMENSDVALDTTETLLVLRAEGEACIKNNETYIASSLLLVIYLSLQSSESRRACTVHAFLDLFAHFAICAANSASKTWSLLEVCNYHANISTKVAFNAVEQNLSRDVAQVIQEKTQKHRVETDAALLIKFEHTLTSIETAMVKNLVILTLKDLSPAIYIMINFSRCMEGQIVLYQRFILTLSKLGYKSSYPANMRESVRMVGALYSPGEQGKQIAKTLMQHGSKERLEFLRTLKALLGDIYEYILSALSYIIRIDRSSNKMSETCDIRPMSTGSVDSFETVAVGASEHTHRPEIILLCTELMSVVDSVDSWGKVMDVIQPHPEYLEIAIRIIIEHIINANGIKADGSLRKWLHSDDSGRQLLYKIVSAGHSRKLIAALSTGLHVTEIRDHVFSILRTPLADNSCLLSRLITPQLGDGLTKDDSQCVVTMMHRFIDYNDKGLAMHLISYIYEYRVESKLSVLEYIAPFMDIAHFSKAVEIIRQYHSSNKNKHVQQIFKRTLLRIANADLNDGSSGEKVKFLSNHIECNEFANILELLVDSENCPSVILEIVMSKFIGNKRGTEALEEVQWLTGKIQSLPMMVKIVECTMKCCNASASLFSSPLRKLKIQPITVHDILGHAWRHGNINGQKLPCNLFHNVCMEYGMNIEALIYNLGQLISDKCNKEKRLYYLRGAYEALQKKPESNIENNKIITRHISLLLERKTSTDIECHKILMHIVEGWLANDSVDSDSRRSLLKTLLATQSDLSDEGRISLLGICIKAKWIPVETLLNIIKSLQISATRRYWLKELLNHHDYHQFYINQLSDNGDVCYVLENKGSFHANDIGRVANIALETKDYLTNITTNIDQQPDLMDAVVSALVDTSGNDDKVTYILDMIVTIHNKYIPSPSAENSLIKLLSNAIDNKNYRYIDYVIDLLGSKSKERSVNVNCVAFVAMHNDAKTGKQLIDRMRQLGIKFVPHFYDKIPSHDYSDEKSVSVIQYCLQLMENEPQELEPFSREETGKIVEYMIETCYMFTTVVDDSSATNLLGEIMSISWFIQKNISHPVEISEDARSKSQSPLEQSPWVGYLRAILERATVKAQGPPTQLNDVVAITKATTNMDIQH